MKQAGALAIITRFPHVAVFTKTLFQPGILQSFVLHCTLALGRGDTYDGEDIRAVRW